MFLEPIHRLAHTCASAARRSRALAIVPWLVLSLHGALSGCVVRTYQPMSGLHRSVVVNPRLENFRDVRLTVRCVPEDLLNVQQASALCQKVGTLFENQGALVRTTVGGPPEEGFDDEADGADEADGGGADGGGADGDGADGVRTDLTLELRARRVHEANNPLLWAICLGSFTLVPAITEFTFAQDVAIRDARGFLLVSESLEGRIVRYFGAGTWLGNKILDIGWRDDDEDLTGAAFGQDLSGDVYQQLSQLLFNARMQWRVLQQAPTVRAE